MVWLCACGERGDLARELPMRLLSGKLRPFMVCCVRGSSDRGFDVA